MSLQAKIATLNQLLRNDKKQLLWKIKRSSRLAMFSRLYLDLDKDTRNTIIVAGSGRSGTTWLADIVNYNIAFRIIFEPFHQKRVKEWQTFKHRQYLNPNNEDIRTYRAVETILQGNFKNRWADSHNRKFFCKKRLIKEISINNILGYIHSRFPEIKILYLLRHPCAVASSRLRLGWDSYPDPTVITDLNVFLDQGDLMCDHFETFRNIFKTSADPFTREIVFWAAENWLPVRQFYNERKVKFVFYENLVLNPKEEIPLIFEYLGIRLKNPYSAGRRSVLS